VDRQVGKSELGGLVSEYPPFGLGKGAIEHPDRLAVADDFGRTLSYGELDSQVNRTIRALNDRGVEPGDVIGLLLENRVEAVLLHQAAYRGGFLFTPLNPRLKPSELQFLVSDSGAKVVFVDGSYLELAKEVAPDGVEIVVVDDSVGANDLDSFISGFSDDPVEHGFGSVLSYTSGTSGVPKAVIRDRAKPSPEGLAAVVRFGERLGFDPDHDRLLVTAPLYHGGPLISALHVVNLQGSVYLMRRFDADDVLDRIERFEITSAYMVPTMYHRLLALPEERRNQADLSSLNSVMHTGAPCPIHLKRAMIDWVGPILYDCYAATESFGTYTVCTSEQWLAHPGTVGKPEHDVITIRDENENPLPAGEIGLIYAKTLPGIAPFRYRGDEEKTRRAYSQHGDYTVGDMGYLDEDGFLFLTGRASDMIISGGVNVYPAEVEQVLLRHEAVGDAAVFGIPDDEWGELIIAAVELNDGADRSEGLESELIGFCRDQIAAFKCPREVHIVDNLGRDPSGKIRKGLIRERLFQPGRD
jgi:long-chain acyl-CoA synthetase